MDFRTASRLLTEERSKRKHRPKTANGRPRKFLETPVGQLAAKASFKLLVDFFDGKLETKPKPAKPWLRALISECGICNEELALMMLAPLLDGASRGWPGCNGESASMLVVKQMGLTCATGSRSSGFASPRTKTTAQRLGMLARNQETRGAGFAASQIGITSNWCAPAFG